MSLWNLLSKRILENSPYRRNSQIEKCCQVDFGSRMQVFLLGSGALLINMQK
jgi:hypothetical protein